MKKLICLMIMLLVLPNVFANVLISEVLYDPITSELDTEYVEIFNQGKADVDINGWILNTTSIQAIIPPNTILAAKSYFLIADEDDGGNWPENWVLPDYSDEEISLVNSDSGVQLIDSYGNIVDVVGWGAAPPGLFESTAHEEVSPGESLTRIKINNTYIDTNDNSADFYAALPNPSNSAQTNSESIEINLYASVTGSKPRIDFLNISPDESSDFGIQIYPSPGREKIVTIETIISDAEGYDDITSAVLIFELGNIDLVLINQINQSSALYKADLNMNFYHVPKNYSIELIVVDNLGLEARYNTNFEYLGVVAFEVDTDSIYFGGNAGSFSEVVGDVDMNTPNNPTIRNLGNLAIDFEIFGRDLISEFDTISVSNIEYSFLDNDYSSGGVLSAQPTLENVNLQPGLNQLRELTTRLNIPIGTSIGDYSGGLSLIGVKS